MASPIQTVDGPDTNSKFGHTVSGAGDINGDGYDDVLVGAFGAGLGRAGAIYLYLGSPQGIGPKPSWTYACPSPGSEFGHQVEGVGDVNGDGFDDFVAGATYYSAPGTVTKPGGAFVFHGGSAGPGSKPDWQMVGVADGSKTGFAVAAAGDVNGDGYADVLVGAFMQPALGAAAPAPIGCAYLYLGGSNGLSTTPAWSTQGDRVNGKFGYTLHGKGDFNGDGYSDIAIGGWGSEAEMTGCGRVYVYYGGARGPSTQPDWTVTGTHGAQLMGNSVFSAGDVNGDGYDDLLVAANGTSHPEALEGLVLLFYGGPDGLQKDPARVFEVNTRSFFLGHSVASAGDLNGDGYADIVISAFNGWQKLPDEGVAFVYLGSAKGPSLRPDWSFRGGQTHGGYGSTVRSAGDVNGDGYADLVVGHTYYSGSIPRQGRAWIHYGSASGLAQSSAWGSGLESLGFAYRNLTLPLPDRVLTTGFGILMCFAIWLVLRRYHQHRERQVLALQHAHDAAQMQERQRIAQDLHDQLGAELTQIVLASANARRQIPHPDGTTLKLEQIQATAGRLVENLAEIVWLTKPSNDSLIELAGYLGDLVSRTLENAGIRCRLDIPVDLQGRPIPFDLRHDVMLAVKEAVHNAIKHSGATLVSLSIRESDGELVIVVGDDGRGFQPTTEGRSGNGIRNMSERLQRHGGSFEIRSGTDGVGTRLTFSVPLPSTEARL